MIITFVQTQGPMHLDSVDFTVCKLLLNKVNILYVCVHIPVLYVCVVYMHREHMNKSKRMHFIIFSFIHKGCTLYSSERLSMLKRQMGVGD
jgi:hypothetical protein